MVQVSLGKSVTLPGLVLIGAMFSLPAVADPEFERCLMRRLKLAAADVTVGELRATCEAESQDEKGAEKQSAVVPVFESGAMRERLQLETDAENSPFIFTPHFPNYIGYSSFEANQAPFTALTGINDTVEDHEAVFQISFKAPIWRNMFGTELNTYFAYTSKSWWQVANDDFSSPFRETNYMPELFVRDVKGLNVLGLDVVGWTLGVVHESNGREQGLSRSWNRVVGRAGIQLSDDISLFTQLWYRIPDDEDDNPNEYRFYGYGDVRAVWTPNRDTFTAMLRPGTDKTSYELTWSRPISRVFRLYASYYNGYGENLLDYDFNMRRFTIGVALNDFVSRQ